MRLHKVDDLMQLSSPCRHSRSLCSCVSCDTPSHSSECSSFPYWDLRSTGMPTPGRRLGQIPKQTTSCTDVNTVFCCMKLRVSADSGGASPGLVHVWSVSCRSSSCLLTAVAILHLKADSSLRFHRTKFHLMPLTSEELEDVLSRSFRTMYSVSSLERSSSTFVCKKSSNFFPPFSSEIKLFCNIII